MGTTYGAEELGRCSHGLACRGRRLGPLHRVLPRKLTYLDKTKIKKTVRARWPGQAAGGHDVLADLVGNPRHTHAAADRRGTVLLQLHRGGDSAESTLPVLRVVLLQHAVLSGPARGG
jgi:hypothetical protein